MPTDGTDVTDTDGELIAPIIPLHRQTPAPALTVLADEPAPPRREPEQAANEGEHSIWGPIATELPRREPSSAGSRDSTDRGRGRAVRWGSLCAGVLGAAALITVALLLGAIPGLTSHATSRLATTGTRASTPPTAVTAGRHTTRAGRHSATPRRPQPSTRHARPSVTIASAERAATGLAIEQGARATPAPGGQSQPSSPAGPTQPSQTAASGQEFGFEQ
jgi:hypothetical protein